jgi:CheY-like chemotaxis protein
LHGGSISVESGGEGQGATFTVTLPLMPLQPPVSQNSSSLELTPNLSGVRILVVDDDTDTREFVAFLLEQVGAEVIAVASADAALMALSQTPVDVLLSDIGMPDTDGYMLIRQVRALSPEQGGEVKAIALTAYAGELNQQQVLQAGFQQHIAKPVDPQQLIKTIASLFEDSL